MHGGARPGAGRKPGSPNKVTAAKVAAIEASGMTPLDFMLKVMRDEDEDMARRCDMAKGAAPYVHAKLASIDANLHVDGQLTINVNKPGVSSDNSSSR
jgi:hypothetical protein